MFSRVFSVCCRMSVPTNSPVFGSSATCPDIYRNPFARMPCEYGPMGFGPRSVDTTSLMVSSPWWNFLSRQLSIHIAPEIPLARPDASSTFSQIRPHCREFPVQTTQLSRRDRSPALGAHLAYTELLFERFPSRNDPATHKRTRNSLREER